MIVLAARRTMKEKRRHDDEDEKIGTADSVCGPWGEGVRLFRIAKIPVVIFYGLRADVCAYSII